MRICGEICLLASFVGSGYAAFSGLASADARFARLARGSTLAAMVSFVALTMTLAILAWALVAKDFGFEYVAHYTSRLLPWHYSLSALWVGQAGSLLLWTWLLVVLSLVFGMSAQNAGRLEIVASGMLWANVFFLTAVMVFAADPMKASLSPRAEGLGLSPLLQHPSMLIHPPVVFLAYAAWAVPFALAAAALITGELDSRWLALARPWAVIAWTILGAGLLLGAHWAYQELGWGGYWGWDPVENGSLIPWLTGTALVHALMAWRHRGCLKKTAIALAVVTLGLCNFATFLTRSGIFSSVHAFSQSPIGWMFLAWMVVLLGGGGALLVYRRRQLTADRPLTSIASREALIFISTCLLVLLTVVVLVGTLYVPLSTLVAGRMIQIGPAFYNNVFMPIGILLLTLTAIVPLVRWGAPPRKIELQALLFCFLGSGLAIALACVLGLRHPAALAVTGIAALAVCTFLAGLLLQIRPYPFAASAWDIVARRRRQYAGYFIHLALVCVAVGITGSSLGTRRHDIDLDEGDAIEWAGRRIEYKGLVQREDSDKLIAEVDLHVSRANNPLIVLKPARHFHLIQQQWTTEVAIHSSWTSDFYTILHAGLGEGRVALTFIENPLMRWLWLGGWLAAAGAAVAAWPSRVERNKQGGLTHVRTPLDATPVRKRLAA
jgi:cytochrome c-type biogenesis protein CcmF